MLQYLMQHYSTRWTRSCVCTLCSLIVSRGVADGSFDIVSMLQPRAARLTLSPGLTVPLKTRPKASKVLQSCLGYSLAMCMSRGPRGLQAFTCSTMSASCGPVYSLSTCKPATKLTVVSPARWCPVRVRVPAEQTADFGFGKHMSSRLARLRYPVRVKLPAEQTSKFGIGKHMSSRLARLQNPHAKSVTAQSNCRIQTKLAAHQDDRAARVQALPGLLLPNIQLRSGMSSMRAVSP